MKKGTKVRVTRFNGAKANGYVSGAARVGRRGAWYPVTLDDGTEILCRLAQLSAR
jgi:translation initiation factor IF-1